MKFAIIAMALLCGTAAIARNQGQYTQGNDWFNKQLTPGGYSGCCSDADGVKAKEKRVTDGNGVDHYWASFVASIRVDGQVIAEVVVDWTEIPEKVILKPPYGQGAPIAAVVWWYAQWKDSRQGVLLYGDNGKPLIHVRCYKPESLGN